MRIEELVIEGKSHNPTGFYSNPVVGFKSYPVRTQITGWDPSFNAITGLNGSGKSNILDAICFVLGITNMAQVRMLFPVHADPHCQLCFCRCVRRTNKISYTNVDKLVSPKQALPSSSTTQIGRKVQSDWRIISRSQSLARLATHLKDLTVAHQLTRVDCTP